MPKSSTSAAKANEATTPKPTENGPAKKQIASAPTKETERQIASRIERPILHPHINVCGVDIPEDALRITVEKAKDMLGWWTETDEYNFLREKDPRMKLEEGVSIFGADYIM